MSTRIYIGRLSYDCRERDLEKFFKGYGRIREILLKNGFGFIEFDDYRDADDAVYELNGKELLGERVTIEHARGQPRGSDVYSRSNRNYRPMPNRRRQGGGGGGGRDRNYTSRYGPTSRTEYRLLVKNLSSRVNWQDLKDYMRQAGEVTYADAHKNRRNEGVVEFASMNDMKNALEKLDDSDLNGRRIHLVEDKTARRSNRRSRSRSKSSRSRSRSKSRRRSSRSKSRSESKSRSRSRSRSKTKSQSRSKSPSPRREIKQESKSKSRSPSKDRGKRSHTKSRSRSIDRERSSSPARSDGKADDVSMDGKED